MTRTTVSQLVVSLEAARAATARHVAGSQSAPEERRALREAAAETDVTYLHQLTPEAVRREVAEVLKSSRGELAQRARTTLGLGRARQAAGELLELAGRGAPEPADMR